MWLMLQKESRKCRNYSFKMEWSHKNFQHYGRVSLEWQQSTSYYKHIEMQKAEFEKKERNLQLPEEGYQSGNDNECDISGLWAWALVLT